MTARFWAMHDQLYQHQDALDDESLLEHAAVIGLDVQRVAHDLATRGHLTRVREDFTGCARRDVNGTPRSSSTPSATMARTMRCRSSPRFALHPRWRPDACTTADFYFTREAVSSRSRPRQTSSVFLRHTFAGHLCCSAQSEAPCYAYRGRAGPTIDIEVHRRWNGGNLCDDISCSYCSPASRC